MALDSSLPWLRYWLERDQASIIDRWNWLADPEGDGARILGDSGRRLDELDDRPCLVLLGEPGSGKSTDVRRHVEVLKASVDETNDRVQLVDLPDLHGLGRLDTFFDADPDMLAWREGSYNLHLYLDALDEVRLLVPRVATRLGRRLEQLAPHLDRMRLRIVCRSADWGTTGLETKLRELYGDGSSVLRIAPLSRPDVAVAAKAEGLDPEAFLREVNRVGAVHLAARPVTLRFLLTAAKERQGSLPGDRLTLYSSGLERLASYRGDMRTEEGLDDNLAVRHKMWVAGWVAASTLLGAHHRIEVAEGVSSEGSVISVGQLAVRLPLVAPETGPLDLTPSLVREVLGTALFEASGPTGVRFAHRTYEEFLAADFLARSGIAMEQLLNLLSAGDDAERRVVPQMRDLAGWLCALRPDFGERLIEVDPPTVLQSPFLDQHPEARETLVRELLGQVGSGRLMREWGWYEHYSKLQHDRLADQLTEAITGAASASTKALAVEIAECAGVAGTGPALATAALDPAVPEYARVRAVEGVTDIGTRDDAVRLRPLLEGEVTDRSRYASDRHGGVLRALVVHGLLTFGETLEYLDASRWASIGGAWDKLLEEVTSRLDVETLPIALRWLADRNLPHSGADLRLADFAAEVVRRALGHLDQPPVWRAVGALAVKAGEAHVALTIPITRPGRPDKAHLGEQSRRSVIDAMVGWWARRPLEHPNIRLLPLDCRDAADFPWLVEQAARERGHRPPHIRLYLARPLFDSSNHEHVRALLAARETCPTLVLETFRGWFTPIELDSEDARSIRRTHRDRSRCERRRRQERIRGQWSVVRAAIHARAQAVRAGGRGSWQRLLRVMCITEDGSFDSPAIDRRLDVAGSPGWSRFPELRPAVLAAARAHMGGLAGRSLERQDYAALFLLWREDRAALAAIAEGNWHTWASAIVRHGIRRHFDGDEAAARELLREAYRQAPEAFITAVNNEIDRQIENHGALPPLVDLLAIADGCLRDVLVGAVRRDDVDPNRLRNVLGELFEAKVVEAEELS